MTETKKCECCPTILERGNLSSYNWKRLQFCKPCRMSWRRRNKTQYDTCKTCGEEKPVARFKQSKRSPKGYTQPCKACDCAKNKLGGRVPNTKHLDPYLTIPWTRAA